jgi:hypothetical protein
MAGDAILVFVEFACDNGTFLAGLERWRPAGVWRLIPADAAFAFSGLPRETMSGFLLHVFGALARVIFLIGFERCHRRGRAAASRQRSDAGLDFVAQEAIRTERL